MKRLRAHDTMGSQWGLTVIVVTLTLVSTGPAAWSQVGFPGPTPFPPVGPGPGFPGIPLPTSPPITNPLPGLPGTGGQGLMVFDPAHIVETIANGQQMLKQIENQIQQIEHEVSMLKKLADPPWRDIEGRMIEMENLLRQGEAIAYSVTDLGRLLAETFPGTAPYVVWVEEYVRQIARSMDTQENILMSLQGHWQQFATSHQQLREIKDRMPIVEGQTAALELGNTLSAFAAEELILMRQLIAAQTNALAVYQTYQMNRDAQMMATRRELYESESTPLPGKTFTGGSRDIFR